MWNLKQRKPLLCQAILLSVMAATSTVTSADDGAQDDSKWIRAPFQHVPLSAKLKVGSDKPFISGLFADHVFVVLKNHTKDQAVAVRNLSWWEGGRESLDWYGPVAGSTEQFEKGDVVVSLNETVQSLSSVAFEKGLLLPGQELTVYMPFTPQTYSRNTVQVDYIAVGDDENPWQDQVLMLGPSPAFLGKMFMKVSPDSMELIERQGGLGLLRSTMNRETKSPQMKSGHFKIPIPLENDPDPNLTGGLTFDEAAERAGAANEDEGYLGFYLPKMKTWLFIRGDGLVRTLRPKGEGWTFDFAKNMPAWIPEYFGRGEAPTAILLNPEIFGEIVDVQTPWVQMYYNPGLTHLDADELWQVLQLVNRKLGLEIESVVINPNGLGKSRVLTIGVKVDSSGKWIRPAIEPREVPLNPR